MTTKEIEHVQARIGTTVDGQWGPMSTAACKDHLKRLMPAKPKFPRRSEIGTQTTIFGQHGREDGFTPPTSEILLPFPIFYEGKPVHKLHPHREIAKPLANVFSRLAEAFPSEESKHVAGILVYDGLYNPRLMRGSGGTWSMHSWAIAIDLDAENNMLNMHWPRVARMPIEVMECFAAEGFCSLGGMESRDAMHFEATSGN